MRYIEQYSIVSGSLPTGLSLDSKTGKLQGQPFPDYVTTWVTPEGSSWTFDDQDAVEGISLEALPSNGATTVQYSLTTHAGNRLPWGLLLDGDTGVIAGTLERIPTKLTDIVWAEDEQPLWETPAGTLGDYSEDAGAVSLSISATPQMGTSIAFYQVLEGGLPWGLTLNRATGVISGTVENLFFNAGEMSPKTPVPTWNVAAGRIATLDEGAAVNLSLTATPQLGTTMFYRVIDGGLPWGLTLNRTTGAVSGTVAELKEPLLSHESVANPPDIQTADLGTVTRGTAASLALTVALAATRSLASVTVVPSDTAALPFGLLMNRASGAITGTVDANARLGQYSFNVRVVDSAGAASIAPLTMTVV